MDKLRLGIVVDNLSPSQLSFYLLKSANEFLLHNSEKMDLILFTKNLSIPVLQTNMIPLMNLSELYDYQGVVICTSIYDAVNLIKYPCGPRKIFYSYDLDWLRMQRDWAQLNPIYNNNELELWCRSEAHKDLLELTWGKNVSHVLEELKVEDIYKRLTND